MINKCNIIIDYLLTVRLEMKMKQMEFRVVFLRRNNNTVIYTRE